MTHGQLYLFSILASLILVGIIVLISKHIYLKTRDELVQSNMTGKELILLILFSFIPILNIVLTLSVTLATIFVLVFDSGTYCFGMSDKKRKFKEFLNKNIWPN